MSYRSKIEGEEIQTSLDHDLKVLRQSKFNTELAEQAKSWILNIIKESSPDDFIPLIKSGVVLCKLAQALSESTNYGKIKYKESSMPFIQMENISNFLNFIKAYGVPQDEIFTTIDLYEEQDTTIVLQTIVSLSRYAHERDPSKYEVIGPKLAKKKPPVKPSKPIHLKGWSTAEYGYMKGSSQATEGVVFGNKRDVV